MRFLSFGLLLVALPALGHASLDIASDKWSFESAVVWPILLLVCAYISGVFHLRQQMILQRVLSRGCVISFMLGIVSLVLALMSPLDSLADSFFSAHMTQHLILMLVAPPLLILGRMEIVLLWTFPLSVRRAIGKNWLRATSLRSIFNWLMHPVIAWLLASVTMWFWHIPGPYTWAFNNPIIHIIEHLSFFLTSIILWTLVMQPFRRNRGGHGTALILLTTFALESSLLGALLAFSEHSYYSVHAANALRLSPDFLKDITQLQDQQLAGLIMWVPASLVQLVALGAIFHNWFLGSPKSSRINNIGNKITG